MDLALGHGVRSLGQQSGQAGIGLNLGRGLVNQVGGTPGQSVEALHLALLAGQILSQLVQHGGAGRIGLGLDAHQLAAVEGAQVVLLAVNLEGGQVGGAQIVAQDVADGLVAPGAADDDGGALVEGGSVRRAQEHGGLNQLLHALDGDQALGAVEGILHGDELAVGVGGPLRDAAGGKEEGRHVPGGGVHLKGEVLVGGFAVGNQLLQGVQIFLGDDGLVVVHEVAVVRGQGVSVELFTGSGGGDDAGVIVGLDEVSGAGSELGQSTGLNQTGELVLREAVDVAAGLHVSDHQGGGVSLADGLHLGVDDDAELIGLVEVLDLLLGQIDSRVGDPDGDIISTGQIGGDFLLSLFLGLLAAAGSQREDHSKSEKHC